MYFPVSDSHSVEREKETVKRDREKFREGEQGEGGARYEQKRANENTAVTAGPLNTVPLQAEPKVAIPLIKGTQA